MSHHHDHGHSHSHDHHTGNIQTAFWLNTCFALAELAGGYYTNSIAITSDALHDLGDSISLGTSWYFEKKSRQKRDHKFSYGYKRFSLLGAFINSIVLVVGSVFVIKESVLRLFTPEQPDTSGMIWLAVLGILVNGAAMLRLKKGSSINERVISLHFVEDVLGWAAVLIGAVVMKFWTVPVLDPLLSLGIACYILSNVYKNIRHTLSIVLQATPDHITEEKVKETLRPVNDIKGIHDIHIWSLDGNYTVLSMHVVIDQNSSFDKTEELKEIIKKTLETIGVNHATLELESEQVHCDTSNCDHEMH